MPRQRPPDEPRLPGFDSLLPDIPPAADFDTFWACYPRRQGKDSARRHWTNLTAADRAAAMDALPSWCEFWALARTEQRFIPHGSTWVNQRRWEDDVPDLPSLTRPRGWDGLDALQALVDQGRPDLRALGD